jgi:hypothetical protein
MAAAATAPLMATAQEPTPAVVSPVNPVATVTSVATTAAPAPGVIATAPVPVKKAAVKKLTVPQIIAKVGTEAKLSKAEITALLWIAKHESNFHPTSVSGSGCHGLFQLSSSMVAGHPWTDPNWNTKRAIKYMKGRYGGVLKAQAFWASHRWY